MHEENREALLGPQEMMSLPLQDRASELPLPFQGRVGPLSALPEGNPEPSRTRGPSPPTGHAVPGPQPFLGSEPSARPLAQSWVSRSCLEACTLPPCPQPSPENPPTHHGWLLPRAQSSAASLPGEQRHRRTLLEPLQNTPPASPQPERGKTRVALPTHQTGRERIPSVSRAKSRLLRGGTDGRPKQSQRERAALPAWQGWSVSLPGDSRIHKLQFAETSRGCLRCPRQLDVA